MHYLPYITKNVLCFSKNLHIGDEEMNKLRRWNENQIRMHLPIHSSNFTAAFLFCNISLTVLRWTQYRLKNLQCAIWRTAFTSSTLLVWTLWAVSVCFSQACFKIVSRLGAPQSLQSSCWSDAWQNMKTKPDAGSRQTCGCRFHCGGVLYGSSVRGICTSVCCL